jgi:uncharacterized protein (TIGR02646 family)
MIFVNRQNVAAPAVLVDANGAGVRETARAIAHYNTHPPHMPFNFAVYSNQEVKGALATLFNGKCAYCESFILHIYPGDVEHFRPKGEITEPIVRKPGYYWLGADWSNLLLSCRNCNQKLTHAIHGLMQKKTMGKMNQFPLSDEGVRVRRHDANNGIDPEETVRLLIDPCNDDPEIHFEYDTDSGVIKAKRINGILSEKAKKSIDVYVLQRIPLVFAREKRLIEIHAQIQRVKEAVVNYNTFCDEGDSVKSIYFEKILKRELEKIKSFLNPKEEYLGMARQIIRKFMLDNFNITV